MTANEHDTQELPAPLEHPHPSAQPSTPAPTSPVVAAGAGQVGVVADDDHDGVGDIVGIDEDGDGAVDRQCPVEIVRDKNGTELHVAIYKTKRPPEPDPTLSSIIKSASEYDIGAATRPINEALSLAKKNLAALRASSAWGWRVAWLLLIVGLCGGFAFRGAWYVTGVPRSVRVLELLYRQGHVPPVAEKAARKALIEDGATDPEAPK